MARKSIYIKGAKEHNLSDIDIAIPRDKYIEGLSPAISIDQKTTSKNPRSTVGTVTEINDYLRLLYARIGTPHCPVCGKEISSQSLDEIVDQVLELKNRDRKSTRLNPSHSGE